MIARWIATLLVLFAGLAQAETPPVQQPILRIEAGMHTDAIARIAVSADGRLIATGSYDKTARLWSLPDGRLLRTFRIPIGYGNVGKIYALALSPDGRTLAVSGWTDADESQHVYLFDTISGLILRRLGPLPNIVNDLKFSPDGRWLAAGLNGTNGIRLWDAGTDFSEAGRDTDYSDNVHSLAFGPGEKLAAASNDGFVRLYQLAMDREFKLLRKAALPDSKGPLGLAFAPNGERLAVTLYDGGVSLLDAESFVLLTHLDTGLSGTGFLNAVTWSHDGEMLYAGGQSLVMSWDKGGLGEPHRFGEVQGWIADLAALPSGGVAWGASDPAFGIFGRDGHSLLFRGPATADMSSKTRGNLRISPDGEGVWFDWGTKSQTFIKFDLRQQTLAERHEPPPDFMAPTVTTLPISNWAEGMRPRFAGRELQLQTYETSHSLAIAPDAQSFVLGADWGLYRFDAEGRLLWRASTGSVAWGTAITADGRIVVAALGDGTIHWFRASDGLELMTLLIRLEDRKWIAWLADAQTEAVGLPQVYYAASPEGEGLLGWHINGKTWDDTPSFSPLSQFRGTYYRPDILLRVLSTLDSRSAIKQVIDEANRIVSRTGDERDLAKLLPPIVEIRADPRGIETRVRQVQLDYRLSARSGRKIDRIEVRIDGSLVRGMTEIPDADDYETLDIIIPPRNCEVSIVAFHDDQASAPATVKVTWTGPQSDAPKPKLRALLVGISKYADPSLQLEYADDDAVAFAAALKKQEGKFFSTVEVTTLVDDQADLSAIGRELARLRKEAEPDDYTAVFLAGHGRTSPQGDFYFLPHDVHADPGDDEFAALSTEALYKYLGRTKGKVLLFIDACHAGNGVGAPDMTGFINQMTGEDNSIFMFASSLGREVSEERTEWRHGAFTKALLDSMEDAKTYGDDDLLLTLELELSLRERVLALTDGAQTPAAAKSRALVEHFNLAAF